MTADFYVDPQGRVRDRNPWPSDDQPAMETPKPVMRPDSVSREVPDAPARGRVDAYQGVTMLPQGDDFRAVEEPYRAGKPGVCRDIFDDMTDQALRRRSGKPPFTRLEVETARDYRALHERVQSSGLKMSSVFMQPRRQGKVDFMDAFMRDKERLDMFLAAIGDGIAMHARRIHKTSVGPIMEVSLSDLQTRRPISNRELVDWVCLRERSFSCALRAFGWSDTGKNINTLRAALRASLGRMVGI